MQIPVPEGSAWGSEFLWALLDAAPVAIVLTDAAGIVRLVNRAAERLFGYARAELLGIRIEALVPDDARAAHVGMRASYLASPWSGRMGEGREVRAQRRDGSRCEVEIALTPFAADGDRYVLAAIADVSERRRLEREVRRANETLEQRVLERTAELESVLREREALLADLRTQGEALQRLSREDALTGLANRREFDRRLAVEISRADRQATPLAIAMLDLDRFKAINDRWGHAVGDAVLRESAALLRSQCRATDAIGRWGGEEFALALPSTDIVHAAHLCERIRDAFERHDWAKLQPGLAVTVSAGVAECHPGLAGDTCVALADSQLYRAKQGGRNRVEPAPHAALAPPSPVHATTE